MDKIKQVLGIIGLLALLSFPAFLQAQSNETIEEFNTVLEIREDGVLEVEETIRYRFVSDDRHGIYREIPKTYEENGEKYKLIIPEFSVNSDTAPNKIKREDSNSRYVLRIGDPNETISSGLHTYKISYTAENAVSFYEEFDEIYWNATGSEWDVPIERASFTIRLPEELPEDDIQYDCYQGVVGAETQCDDITLISNSENETVSGVQFSATNLAPLEGLTGALGFPKGVVPETEKELAGISTASLFLMIGGLFTALIAFFWWAIAHWRKYGRDPEGRGTIVRQYDVPEDLSPAELGLMVDEKINSHDITAEIVYLAEQGYLHILSIPKKILFFKNVNFYLLKMKEEDEGLKTHQQQILSSLFSSKYTLSGEEKESLLEKVSESSEIRGDRGKIKSKIESSLEITPIKDLKNKFYVDLKSIKKELERSMTEVGYFTQNPNEVRKKYNLLFILPFLAMFFLPFVFGLLDLNGSVGIALSLSIFFILIFMIAFVIFFANAMVQKTKKGVSVREHTLGLKEYLSIAEKDRLEFHFNPRNNPKLFEKFLPYAIALGVDKQWASELEDIYLEPDWYTDANRDSFTAGAFYSSFSGFDTAVSSSYSSPSSSGSSGGGSAGGGAGGGGGGSW
ncbi:MAG: DUF2207 domain-containing protein [Candidatus Campbellbacteria bacterium]|nr:DUF2207 domain-containing protein [Candidatus Campbellbacteria bacterium]